MKWESTENRLTRLYPGLTPAYDIPAYGTPVICSLTATIIQTPILTEK